MLFRPLPYEDADRVYRLAASAPGSSGGLRAADYLRVRDAPDRVFEHVGEYSLAEFQGPELAYNVSSGFLETLGVRPTLGRLFDRSEYRTAPEPADAALITWATRQRSFGARSDVLEQSVVLRDFEGQSWRFRVAGVLPPENPSGW